MPLDGYKENDMNFNTCLHEASSMYSKLAC